MSTEFAWAAGFVDGEGYLALRPAGRSFGPKIEVAQISTAPLERLRNMFGGQVITLKMRKNRRQAYRWDLLGRSNIEYALKCMLPYMTVKAKQAELMLDFVSTLAPKNSGRRVTEDVKEQRQRIFAEMCALRKGA